MKRLLQSYRKLLGILFKEAPVMVIMTFLTAIVLGLMTPLSVYVDSHIFNDGLAITQGRAVFQQYIPFLVLFFFLEILPPILNGIFLNGYVESRCMLIMRTTLKGELLKKLKRVKYEHFENEQSMEIIDKTFNRTEDAARHLFPLYLTRTISSIVASAGALIYLAGVKWWLLITVLAPFFLETWWTAKHNDNIYDKLEEYWKRERGYTILGEMLKKRIYLRENKLFHMTDYLVKTYRKRLNARNREYEKYYLAHLKRYFTADHLTLFAPVINVLLLLMLFLQGEINIGLFISLSLLVFGTIYNFLEGTTVLLYSSGYHLNFLEYYDKFFSLSEEEPGGKHEVPQRVSIEFRNVWFRYPGTDCDILKGLSFKIKEGEKISLVGKNGEGKSTIIKLLLGLFEPCKGEILINGETLSHYSDMAKGQIFGTVFQDFTRYNISVRENVILGDIKNASETAYRNAVQLAKAEEIIERLPERDDTLLGREFEGSVDISGGQWQRIAIARAFMGHKPALILDEPTSQLDPIAESNLYEEFLELAKEKTTIFVTHRLASTRVTDRILVLANGRIAENGSHQELMNKKGIYAEMFESQKKWYQRRESFHENMEGSDRKDRACCTE